MMTGEHQSVADMGDKNGPCLSMTNRGIITPYCLLIDFVK